MSTVADQRPTPARAPSARVGGAVPLAAVLVVDDQSTNRYMLSQHVRQLGHRAAAVENGRQALERLRSETFDLVLLDVIMPEMDGYAVLERMKADERLREIPVIVVSGLGEIQSVVRCIEMGAEDYLHKPFNATLLQARIHACLEKKWLRDREVLYLQQIEAEQQRADELLHVILPHPIVEELKATDGVEPRLHENVAVLFCDIVEFTAYCEKRPPREIVSNLQELVEVYEGLARGHEMEKIKTTGDEFMATAGLLAVVANPVLNCVTCGLEMIAAAQRLPAAWTARIGVHVGPVVAGVVGHRQFLYDLWGDTVNTAARVEQHGANGAVNVSRAAWEQIADQCEVESLGATPVKGKGEMEILRVVGLKRPVEANASPR